MEITKYMGNLSLHFILLKIVTFKLIVAIALTLLLFAMWPSAWRKAAFSFHKEWKVRILMKKSSFTCFGITVPALRLPWAFAWFQFGTSTLIFCQERNKCNQNLLGTHILIECIATNTSWVGRMVKNWVEFQVWLLPLVQYTPKRKFALRYFPSLTIAKFPLTALYLRKEDQTCWSGHLQCRYGVLGDAITTNPEDFTLGRIEVYGEPW